LALQYQAKAKQIGKKSKPIGKRKAKAKKVAQVKQETSDKPATGCPYCVGEECYCAFGLIRTISALRCLIPKIQGIIEIEVSLFSV
jgi:hypothetical protein